MPKGKSKFYRVKWEIDIDAQSPEQAVDLAVNYLLPMEPARWSYSALNHDTGERTNHEGQDLFAHQP